MEVKHEKSRIKINAGNATVFRGVFYFCASKNKRSATERAKDALHSSESGGGLCGCELRQPFNRSH